jgi:hypothetical protein
MFLDFSTQVQRLRRVQLKVLKKGKIKAEEEV